MLDLQLRAELAGTNPLAYYHLIERYIRGTCQYYNSTKATSSSTSRTGHRSSGYVATSLFMDVNVARSMLQLPNLLSSEEQQERLLPTWQHYKAYTSAMASWMKVWLLLLQESWLGGEGACRDTRVPANFTEAAQRRGSSVPEGRERWIVSMLGELHLRIHELLLSSVCDIDWRGAEAAAAVGGRECVVGTSAEAARQKPTSSAIQLVLLMLMTRGVVAAGQLLLGTEGGGGQGSSSNKGVRGKGKDKAMAISISISGSNTGGKSSHDSGKQKNQANTSSNREVGSSKSSSSSSTGGYRSGQPMASPAERQALFKAALAIRHIFARWHAHQTKGLEGLAKTPASGSGGTRPAAGASPGKEGVAKAAAAAGAAAGGGSSEGSGGHGLEVARGGDTAAAAGAPAWAAGNPLTLQVEKARKAGTLAGEETRGSEARAEGAATGSESSSSSIADFGLDAVGSRIMGTIDAAGATPAAAAVAKVPKRLAKLPQQQ